MSNGFNIEDLRPENINKAIAKLTFSDALACELLKDLFRDIEEGLNMSEILEDMTLLPNQALAMCSTDILNGVRQGKTFSASVDGWFSPTLVSALSVAERSDNFAGIGLQIIETLIESAGSLTSTLLIKVGVPGLYIVGILGFIVYMKGKFFPVLEKLVDKEDWPPDTEMVYFIGEAVEGYWWLLIAIVVGAFVTVKFILANWSGFSRKAADNLPLMDVYTYTQGSRILMQLGILMKAGDSIRHSVLDVMSREPGHSRWYLGQVIERIDSGYPASRAMDVGLFSNREIVGLRRREKQRAFAEAIIEISRRSAEERIKRLETLINVPMLALYGTMAWLMFTVFSGMRIQV